MNEWSYTSAPFVAYTTWTGTALHLPFHLTVLTSVIPQAFSSFLE